MKVITGTIEYTVTIGDDGSHTTEYTSSIDNDIAALCISQYVMENACVGIKETRKGLKGHVKSIFTNNLKKAIAGREGIKVVTDQLLNMYDDYMKGLEEYNAKVAEMGVEPIEVNQYHSQVIPTTAETKSPDADEIDPNLIKL